MEALLAPSLVAARAGVAEKERIFHVQDHVFLGTKFGAGDRGLLESLGIRAVVNLTAGSSRVPNHFEGTGIDYLHIELMDELISDPLPAAPRGCEAIRWWGDQGTRVLVHCHAGLSRSVTVVIAWLMRDRGLSLDAAATLVTQRRGRRPRCNPSFWCFLAGLERELRGWQPCTPPSFDFSQWLAEDLAELGLEFPESKIAEALRVNADWVNFELFYFALCGWGFKALISARCVAQRSKASYAEAHKAASMALEMIEVYKVWPAVQVFCLQILQKLVLHGGDEKLARAIINMGSVSKILKAMSNHPSSADVQSASFAALAYLGACSNRNMDEILLLGGVSAIVQAMTDHSSLAEVQANGCAVLMVLASRRGGEASIVGYGAVQAALRAMWDHPTAVNVQDFGCAVIAKLAEDPSGWTSAVGSGAEQAVSRAMLMHPGEAAVQEKAAKALRALSSPYGVGQQAAPGPCYYSHKLDPAAAPWVPSMPQEGMAQPRLPGA